MRTFLAIALPDATCDAIERLQDKLRAGRAVEAENLHLTLAFLGDRDLPELEALNALCEGLSEPAFDITLAGLELFGPEHSPGAVALRAEGGAPLKALRDRCRSLCRQAGIELPRARFRPHVTIARMPRRPEPLDLDRLGRFLQAHGDARIAPFRAGGVTLYRSHLTQAGTDYEVLAEYPLSGAMQG